MSLVLAFYQALFDFARLEKIVLLYLVAYFGGKSVVELSDVIGV